MAWDNKEAANQAREAVADLITVLCEDTWHHDREGRDVMIGIMLDAIVALREVDSSALHTS